MPWIELEIKTIDDEGVNWDAMGARPKKVKTIYRKRLVSTSDLEYINEFSELECFAKFVWSESPLPINGSYEEIASLVLCADDDGEWEEKDAEKKVENEENT